MPVSFPLVPFRAFSTLLSSILLGFLLVMPPALADDDPIQVAGNWQPQVPSQFRNRIQPQPQIPRVGEPVMCRSSGYQCPAGFLCRPLRRTGSNISHQFYECIPPQSCGSNGCMVGFSRQDRNDGTYVCRVNYPSGGCASGQGTWGPRNGGPGIACRQIR